MCYRYIVSPLLRYESLPHSRLIFKKFFDTTLRFLDLASATEDEKLSKISSGKEAVMAWFIAPQLAHLKESEAQLNGLRYHKKVAKFILSPVRSLLPCQE